MPGQRPRGIEVLVKKASVAPEFKALLLARRAAAAEAIGLALEPAEAAMINGVPAVQLEAIVANTTVSPITRSAFLGRAAGAMLAALGAAAAVGPAAADDDPKNGDRPRRYHVCETKDYKGDLRYEVLDHRLYSERATAVRRTNRLIGRAHDRAARVWRADRTRAGVPFPMAEPQPEQCRIVGSFADRELAQGELRKRQERLAKDRKAREQKETKRLEGLSPEERRRADKRAEELRAAHRLFERTLATLPATYRSGRIIVVHGATVDDLERD